MTGEIGVPAVHPTGEQPIVELAADEPVAADTFAGRVHLEWEPAAPVTTMGQLAFFIEYLKQGGLFDGWVAGCPLHLTSPNAPSKRDVLGTVLLSVLAGHWRYAHITALRADAINAPLLGMKRVVSEDAVRRALSKIDEVAGIAWLREQLEYCVRPLLGELWVLDVDTTIKPLYGHQQGAEVSYNPSKRGRPSHVYHSYLMAELRLVLEVEVASGKEHTARHAAPGLWALLDRLGPTCAPCLLRGDNDWGNEGVMSEAERRGQTYLFKLRLRPGVKRVLERAMRESDWRNAGAGWQGKWGEVRLMGWSRQRRVVLLRRRLRQVLLTEGSADGASTAGKAPLQLGFVELDARREAWEYAVLVTSLPGELLTVAQLYRDRGDAENNFDELKNQWGWGGFTTHDVKRCQFIARIVALAANWWNLFVRLADPDQHREAITSRPLLLQAIGRQTQHAGQTTITITSPHGNHYRARRAFVRIARFFAQLRQTAEQLTDLDRWYRILSFALVKYLKGRQLDPPRRLQQA
jgi:Transposase DDE domain group 1